MHLQLFARIRVTEKCFRSIFFLSIFRHEEGKCSTVNVKSENGILRLISRAKKRVSHETRENLTRTRAIYSSAVSRLLDVRVYRSLLPSSGGERSEAIRRDSNGFSSPFSTNLNNSRAMSMSAPSAINADFATVKFDDETTEWNNTVGTSQAKSAMSHR